MVATHVRSLRSFLASAVLAAACPASLAQPTVLTQDVKIQASDASVSTGASFGWSSDIDADTAIVGAFSNSDSGTFSGAAYIYERNLGGTDAWGEAKKLTAFDAAAGDQFGRTVRIQGDLVIVGSVFDDDACIGVPLCQSGSVYIFARNQGGADNWGLLKKLTPFDTQPGIEFGYSVDVDADTVIVGAPVGIGDERNGAAYIFQRNQGGVDNWGLVRRITASNADIGDRFGSAVAIHADRAVVGAELGDQSSLSGSAYVFERDAGGPNGWGQVAILTASDRASGDKYGSAVAIDQDTVVVGAHNNHDMITRFGAAYIYRRDAGGTDNWGEVVKLVNTTGNGGEFGESVAIDGRTVVVGDWRYDLNGFTDSAGTVFVYRRDEGGSENWGLAHRLLASGMFTADDFLGKSASVSGGTVLAGAHGTNEFGNFTGAAFLYELDFDDTCPADLAAPFGVLNFFDISAFIAAFNAMDPAADFAAPFGTFNFFDVSAFVTAYNAGCP